MVQHLSIRVPWHDHGWDGTICQKPCGNTACLKLNGILESKNEKAEAEICGQCIAGHEDDMCHLQLNISIQSQVNGNLCYGDPHQPA